MNVVVLTNDMMAGSQVTAAAKAAGHTASMALNLERMVALAATGPTLVIVDLNFPPAEPAVVAGRLAELPEPRPKVAAFGPHVFVDKLSAARQAGFAAVFTRGQLLLNLPAVLAELTAGE